MQGADYLYSNPYGLMDALIETMELDDDEDLAEALGVSLPLITKLRNKQVPINPLLLLKMLEVSETGVKQLNFMILAKRAKYH